ncbi:hypothetical protein Hanom_Chr12g01157021 [Helianthus anomalus]
MIRQFIDIEIDIRYTITTDCCGLYRCGDERELKNLIVVEFDKARLALIVDYNNRSYHRGRLRHFPVRYLCFGRGS